MKQRGNIKILALSEAHVHDAAVGFKGFRQLALIETYLGQVEPRGGVFRVGFHDLLKKSLSVGISKQPLVENAEIVEDGGRARRHSAGRGQLTHCSIELLVLHQCQAQVEVVLGFRAAQGGNLFKPGDGLVVFSLFVVGFADIAQGLQRGWVLREE